MELRQIRQFLALAESGSFSLAAEKLHMAQPALSVAIRKLEEELGTPLFVRQPRGVQLTAAGLAATGPARQALAAAVRIKESAMSAASGETGLLRIGFSGSVTVRLLPQVVQAFSHRFPAVRLELEEGTNLELLTKVESGSLDAGLVRVPARRPPALSFQLMEKDIFCLALPKDHPLAKRKKVKLAELENHAFIGYAPSPVGGLHAAASELLQRAGVAPRITQEAVQVQTVLGLVASGLGIALVPAANTPFQQSTGAVFRPISDLPANSSIGIALAKRQDNENPALQHFVQVCQEPRDASHHMLG